MKSTRNLVFVAMAASVLLVTGASSARAQCELAKVKAADGAQSDRFGWSVAVSGTYAVVGALKDDDYGGDSGAAFLFERNGPAWEQVVKLSQLSDGTPSELTVGDQYGRAVAISGDVAVVGAVGRDKDTITDCGAAYVYRRDPGAGWQLEALLRAADFESDDKLGESVAIDGVRIVIGAPGRNESQGAAYVFKYEAGAPEKWVQENRLVGSQSQAADDFGSAVDIDGDRIVVGAAKANGDSKGEAYIFHREPGTGWEEIQKLTAVNDAGQDDSGDQDFFGNSVSISGDRLVIAAKYKDGACPGAPECLWSGSVYVFRLEGTTWVIEKKLTASDAEEKDEFGRAVSISGDLLFVGAYKGNNPDGVETGSAYLYRRDGTAWIDLTEFNGSEGEASDRFGLSVGLGGDYAIVGAYSDDDNGLTAGAAYVFAVGLGEDCNDNGFPDECDIIEGTSQDTNGNGTPDECECEIGDPCHEIPDLDCTTDYCDEQTRRCVHDVNPGFCAIAAACYGTNDQNPDNECQECNPGLTQAEWSPRTDGASCGDDLTDDACTDPDTCLSGICQGNHAPPGTACPDDDNECTNDVCDGLGGCTHPALPDSTDCADDGNDCTDDFCMGGLCTHPNRLNGVSCGDPTDDDCTDPDTCDGAGTCLVNHADDGIPCPNGLYCDGEEFCESGDCLDGPDPCDAPGLTCDEDTDECLCETDEACVDDLFCNGVETCVEGACESSGDPCTGLGLLCDEDGDQCVECLIDGDCDQTADECTDPDTCVTGACQPNHKPEGIACPDDGNECTDDVCGSGQCTHPNLASGTACGDPTDTICDEADTCDGAGTCQDNKRPDGELCTDDGLFCTGEESCQDGLCQSSGDPCTAPGLICDANAEANWACSCTNDEACRETPQDDLCTLDSCDPVSGTCVHTSIEYDDEEFCNGVEGCDPQFGYQPGSNPCPGQFCDETRDICVDCFDAADCDDGLFCNGEEQCVSDVCAAGTSPCPAGQECDERKNICLECLIGADCDDGDPCTIDRCPDGQCVHTLASWCADSDGDGVINTDDACPGTMAGSEVDEDGCSCDQLDDDGDGVDDCRDECPDTPSGEAADFFGCSCSQLDDDGDGVDDCLDECPDTPEDLTVDENGCSNGQRDDDGDGVPNFLDICDDTPSGESVDDVGCADSQLDTDGDGVTDDVDECPDTPVGAEIDDFGCEVTQPPDDNDNDNDNDNGNENENENENGGEDPGQPVPGPICPCGVLGMLNLAFIGLGLMAMRVSLRRHRCSSRPRR